MAGAAPGASTRYFKVNCIPAMKSARKPRQENIKPSFQPEGMECG